MRAFNIHITEGVREGYTKCGWPGCRDVAEDLFATPAAATHCAFYQIRTGRVQVSMQDRWMGLCVEHVKTFTEKYVGKEAGA